MNIVRASVAAFRVSAALSRTSWKRTAALLVVLLTVASTACAQDRSQPRSEPDRWRGEVATAEAALRRGDRAEATALASRIVSSYEQNGAHNSSEHTSAGRAYVLLGVGDPGAVRAALGAFDSAVAADSGNLEALRRTGALFLDKYNAPDARGSYELVLKRAPSDPVALLGLARVEEFEGKGSPMATAQKSLRADPQNAEALAYIARLHLDAEAFDSARSYAERAAAADSTDATGWGVLGSVAWIVGDSATYRRALSAATALQPSPSEFHLTLAEAAVRQRRYAEAVQLAQRAVDEDSLSVAAYGLLGTTQLRIGMMDAGRAAVEQAFALDPFNLWHKNTLDLLDKMRTFRTIRQGRFEVVAPAEEADLLALYIMPLLDRAFDSLSIRYGYTPPTPVRVEFYRQHADFSVRTVGLNGLGALGVSFGSLLAMDAPNARDRGTFNWGSTAWHELAHAFTLGMSGHRVPRWLSEGLSVLEERRAGAGWGAQTTMPWIMAYRRGVVRQVSQLNDGFLRPRYPEETSFTYYQSSLFCEWVESTRGMNALRALLKGYASGQDTPAVFQSVLRMSPQQADGEFDMWLQSRFSVELASLSGSRARDTTGGEFMTVMRRAVSLVSGKPDSARRLFERARVMFPSYSGPDSPSWFLSKLALERGDTANALTMLAEVTGRSETSWEANLMEADIRERIGDLLGAIAAHERLVWIWPYDVGQHARFAETATAAGELSLAVRERRAVVANRPADMLDARYELARALAAAGNVVEARRELLQVLEEAPGFEKAQTLLLELRQRRDGSAR